jgi:hypothetical protein
VFLGGRIFNICYNFTSAKIGIKLKEEYFAEKSERKRK